MKHKFSIKNEVIQEFTKNPQAAAKEYGINLTELGDLQQLKGLPASDMEERLLKTRMFSMFDITA